MPEFDRYVDVVTVADEAGKGGGLLRQVVLPFVGDGSNNAYSFAYRFEVDSIIRYMYVFNYDALDTLNFTTSELTPSGTTQTFGTAISLAGSPAQTTTNYGLTGRRVPGGTYIWTDVSLAAKPSGSDNVDNPVGAVVMGWMPDIYTEGSNYRTYLPV